jgi:DNA polymerase-3 subunit alpha
MDNTEKVVNFLAEAKAIGLTVLPPDVNSSCYLFAALDAPDSKTPSKTVRYGLGAVKGVGQGAVENIVEARERGGAFIDLSDFCRRVDMQKVNKRALEALILCGAMDALAKNRASVMAQLPECMRAAEQHARDSLAGQHDMFGASSSAPAPLRAWPSVDDWPVERKLTGERETLGYYLSGHPTDRWRPILAQLATCPIGEIAQRFQPPKPRKNHDDDASSRFRRPAETPWIVAGQLLDVRKRGDSMAFAQLEDGSGRIEISFFRDTFMEFGPLLTRDAMLVAEGGLAYDEFAGGLRVRVRRLITLSDACERQTRLIRIHLNGVDPSFTAVLQTAIGGYRGGQTPIRLSYANGEGRAELELGAAWKVRASAELKRALDALPGVRETEMLLARPTLAENDRAA